MPIKVNLLEQTKNTKISRQRSSIIQYAVFHQIIKNKTTNIWLQLWKIHLYRLGISRYSCYDWIWVLKINLPKQNAEIPVIPENSELIPTP